MEEELIPEEEKEYLYLKALQTNKNRWFSGYEYDRLVLLSKKKYKLSEE